MIYPLWLLVFLRKEEPLTPPAESLNIFKLWDSSALARE